MRNNSICHGFHKHILIKAKIDVKNSLDIIYMNVFFILFFKRKLILYLLHGILCILSWCPQSKYFYYYAEGFFIQMFLCFLFVWIFLINTIDISFLKNIYMDSANKTLQWYIYSKCIWTR